MAGFLIYHSGGCVATVLYCELHPQSCSGLHAKLVFYEDESSQKLPQEIFITDRSSCCEKVGINCSCFSIEEHQFSARTLVERKLWLRAISNIKVKLQNRAPSPTNEELGHYRRSIQDHVQSEVGAQSQVAMDALLQRCLEKKEPRSALDGAEPSDWTTPENATNAAPPEGSSELADCTTAAINAEVAWTPAVDWAP